MNCITRYYIHTRGRYLFFPVSLVLYLVSVSLLPFDGYIGIVKRYRRRGGLGHLVAYSNESDIEPIRSYSCHPFFSSWHFYQIE